MAHLIIWNSYDFTKHAPVRPLGPHQLEAWLTQAGYDVQVIDFSSLMTTSQLISATMKFVDKETVAIGVSNTFWDPDQVKTSEPEWVIRARSMIENLCPSLDWILGGTRNSYLSMNLKLQWRKFQGYGEDSVLRYLDEKTGNTSLRQNFDIHNSCRVFNDRQNILPSEVLPIELSRGCQFKCKFCRYSEIGKKKNTYIKNYSLIEDELLSNYEQFGVTRYLVMDDTANESIEKLTELARIAQKLPFKLEWVGYLRLDLIGANPDTAEILLESGLRGCYFGIETFNPAASLAIGKGWNGKKGKDFLLELMDRWDNKVAYEIGFILGLVGETEKDIEDTHNWCKDNNIYSWRWTPLSISRQPEQLWKSDFDINYANYGYRFPYDDSYRWENLDWNYDRAVAKANELNEDRRQLVYLNPWHIGQVANLGYEFDELMKYKAHELNYDEFNERTSQRLVDYVKFLRS